MTESMAGSIAGSIASILSGAGRYVARHRRAYAVVWAAALTATALAWPYDAALLARIQQAGAGSETAAMWLSSIGRFENSSLVLAVALGIGALLGGGGRFRDAAVACLLAGIIGGLAVNVLRPTFGRARPHADAQPGLYWLQLDSKYHSLPSGHATSNMASATAVAVVMPAVGVPAMAMAAAIGWSRLQLNRHYPTDVALGLLLGASVGLPIGAATVARQRRPPSTKRERS